MPCAVVVPGGVLATRLPPSLDDGRGVVCEELEDDVFVVEDVLEEVVVGVVLELLEEVLLEMLAEATLVFDDEPPKAFGPASP